MKDKRILVTGASGGIGSRLVARLHSEGATVGAFVRTKSSSEHIRPHVSTFFEGDVRDETVVTAAVADFKPEYIIHTAGDLSRGPFAGWQLNQDVNVQSARALLRAIAHPVQKIIMLGSLEECAGGPVPFIETAPDSPTSTYSLGKALATRLFTYAGKAERIPTLVLRLSVVYGPGQNTRLFTHKAIEACLKKEKFPMTPGDQTRDYVFVDDVVEALLLSLTKPTEAGEVIHIGSGEEVSIKGLAKHISDASGYDAFEFGALPYRENESMRYATSIDKAKEVLDWSPRTKLKDGIDATVKYYREREK